MTIRQAIQKFSSSIDRDETELLLSHLLGWPKEKLYIEIKHQLTPAQKRRLETMVIKRKQGWPIAYIVGYKYFFGLKFKVNRQVLIPRPESEWIVETVVKFAKNKKQPLNIIDVGTGSGAIAIALAKALPKALLTGIDISASALKIAKQNANSLGVKVKFIKRNLIGKEGKIPDVIIANLPYVPINEYIKLVANLKYEPKHALTDGTNTGLIYAKLFQKITKLRKQPKLILLEIDPSLKSQLVRYQKLYLQKFKISFEKDLHGLIRYVILK